MSAVIIACMASGSLCSPKESTVTMLNDPIGPRMLVQVKTQTAQSIQQELSVQGRVEPNQQVTIRSDIAGLIADVLVNEGQIPP